MLDANAHVVEAISRNLFIAKDGKLFTPILSHAGVEGIMRRIICDDLAPSLSLIVNESEMNVSAIVNCDEMFLCNSITGIWPVRELNEHRFPIGSITRALQSELKNRLPH